MDFFDCLKRQPGPQIAALEQLRASARPVFIYGAGVYAYVLLGYLRALGLHVQAFAVDAEHRKSEQSHGLPLYALESCSAGMLKGGAWVVGITDYNPASARLRAVGVLDPLVIDVPDFLNMPSAFVDWAYVERHRVVLQEAFESLADDLSRRTFIAALNAKLNHDAAFLADVVRPDHLYFWRSECPLGTQECLLDVGGFDGDSLRDFHRITDGQYHGILSLEPFPGSYAELQCVASTLDPEGRRIRTLPYGAWDERTRLPMATREMNIDNRIAAQGEFSIAVDTIDNLCAAAGFAPTLIKMDINGAESRAIAGARQTLRKLTPRLVSKLHVREDFFHMPLLLKDIDPSIRIRLRQRNHMSMMLVLSASHED